MKYIYTLLFILVALSAHSQAETVRFNTEISYVVDKRETLWLLSKDNPGLMIVKNITLSKSFLVYSGAMSPLILNSKNEVELSKIKFKKEREEQTVEVVEDPEKHIVNGYKCKRYLITAGNRKYEAFITKRAGINNIAYLNNLIRNNHFKNGLLLKVNILNSISNIFKPFIELKSIAKTKQDITIDFTKLHLKLNEPPTEDTPNTAGFKILEE